MLATIGDGLVRLSINEPTHNYIIVFDSTTDNIHVIVCVITMAHETQSDILSINCEGIKSNLHFINYLLNNECDDMFVCEHWLKRSDLVENNSIFRNNNFWCLQVKVEYSC